MHVVNFQDHHLVSAQVLCPLQFYCPCQLVLAHCSVLSWQSIAEHHLPVMDVLRSQQRAAAAASCSYTSASAGLPCSARRRHAEHAAGPIHHNTASLAVPQQDPRRCTSSTWPMSAAKKRAPRHMSCSAADTGNPWMLGFQCNERYLEWDDSSHIKFLRLTLARNQGLTEEQVCEQHSISHVQQQAGIQQAPALLLQRFEMRRPSAQHPHKCYQPQHSAASANLSSIVHGVICTKFAWSPVSGG